MKTMILDWPYTKSWARRKTRSKAAAISAMFNCFRVRFLFFISFCLFIYFLFSFSNTGETKSNLQVRQKRGEKNLLIAQKFGKTDLGRRDGMWTRGKMLVAGGKRNAFHEAWRIQMRGDARDVWQELSHPSSIFSLNKQAGFTAEGASGCSGARYDRPEECGERNLWNSLSRGGECHIFTKEISIMSSCRLGKGMDWESYS